MTARDDATVYDPPTKASDERVCKRCRRWTGSYNGARLWTILNTRTGKHHADRGFGDTACGLNATGEEFLWPV